MRRDKPKPGKGLESADLSPLDEIERMDLAVEQAARDEEMTMFDPNTHPKPPHPKEEGVTDLAGRCTVDIQEETPLVDNLTLDGIGPL